MISIQEARRITSPNINKVYYDLPEWAEEIIDESIRAAARQGKFSTQVCLRGCSELSKDDMEAIVSAYIDFCPDYYCSETDVIFYFYWSVE